MKFMVLKEYLRMEEVPDIPTLEKAPASFRHDLVLIAAQPSAAMLIYETALRAGAGAALANTLGRPAQIGLASLSLGCMGNRTFTGLPAEELYVCIPGSHWTGVVTKLTEIGKANSEMQQFSSNHKAQFTSA
jgi:uncharacterized protein (DUF169 family)